MSTRKDINIKSLIKGPPGQLAGITNDQIDRMRASPVTISLPASHIWKFPDESGGITSFGGQVRVVDLANTEWSTKSNVRGYIGNFTNSGAIKSARKVHKNILEALVDPNESFSAMNGGLVILASRARKRKDLLVLSTASVANGGQTLVTALHALAHGVVHEDHFIDVKIIVISGNKQREETAKKIAGARNTQNSVRRGDHLNNDGMFDKFKDIVKDAGGYLGRSVAWDTTLASRDEYIDHSLFCNALILFTPPHMMKKCGSMSSLYASKNSSLAVIEKHHKCLNSDNPEEAVWARHVMKFWKSLIPNLTKLSKRAFNKKLMNARGPDPERPGSRALRMSQDEKDCCTEYDEFLGCERLVACLWYPIAYAMSYYLDVTDRGGFVSKLSEFDPEFAVTEALTSYKSFKWSQSSAGKNPEVYTTIAKIYRPLTRVFYRSEWGPAKSTATKKGKKKKKRSTPKRKAAKKMKRRPRNKAADVKRRHVKREWPKCGTALVADYFGETYEAEVVAARPGRRLESGKQVRITKGPLAGNVYDSFSRAMLEVTQEQRKADELGRRGVSNGWTFWKEVV